MALLTCKECGKEISSTAEACPHCGARRTSALAPVWTTIKIIVALVFGLFVYRCSSLTSTIADSATSSTVATLATATCSPKDFVVSGLKGRREYDSLMFTGTVANNGATACGVQLKVSTYDSQGVVVDTSDFWPASIRNIAAGGKENFSSYLRYDKSVKKYDMVVISAKEWKQ